MPVAGLGPCSKGQRIAHKPQGVTREKRQLDQKCNAGLPVILSLFIIVATALIAPQYAAGQGALAATSGSVLDPSNATIPGAKVLLTNIDTGILSIFPAVIPGRYSLKVTKETSSVAEVENITITVNQTLIQNIHFEGPG